LAVQNRVKKVVFTGSATSVIGQFPVKDEGFVYNDPYLQIEAKLITKPNEKAKILAEKVCWNVIKKQD
jgi:nucleoside-diphosphate-sugar epimerase